MQRFSQRESVLLDYSPQKTFTDTSSSPETPSRNSDIDFNDVFGGPPMRPSIQETRYGFGENKRIDEQVVAASLRNPWSGLSEKPVFGEEEMAQRRRSKSDFFYDIFRGNGSSSASRKHEMKDPLPPKPGGPGPFGSSSPAHFRHPSLPAKLNKGMDLPTFGSFTQTTSKSKDGSSNGLSYYASSPMSKSSGQANQDKEEPSNGFQSSYCFSEGNEESTNLTKYVETERKGNSNEDSSSSEIPKNGSRFHFSIYKWANKGGVPVANPLRGSDRRKEKDKLQRSSSANGWIAHESIAKEPKDKLHNIFYSFNGRSSNCTSFRENENDGELGRIIEEDNITKTESETINKLKSTVKNVSKEVSAVGNATHKPQPKPLNLHLDDDNDDERGNGEITTNSGSKDITEMNVKKLSEIIDGKNTKKQDVKKRATSNVETSATRAKHSPRNSWDIGKARVRGKVKELIKFFNQDSSSRPRTDDALSENHGSTRKERDKVKPEIEPNTSMNKRVEKIQLNSVIKNSYSDIPVDKDVCNGASEKKLNSSVKDTVSGDSKTIVEDPAELFEDDFLIEDLTPEDNNLPQFGVDPEQIKAIDDKIQQWSNGKQGNIRSLLSTLQYVLWPGCGWKPVPLVDIIEGPAVKRSYQKALLCLHPDKLQQKGAASDQKYIAEQVFDILQDAWTHFNSLASV